MMDPMTYFPDMEVLSSGMLEQVLAAREEYHPARYGERDVRQALAGERRTPRDFAALLSPAARPLLEELACRAQRETRAHFGNSVYLFTPLYLSNYCENHCVYCGFRRTSGIQRAKLDAAEMEREMRMIAATGLEEILLLTGESRRMADVEYLGEACRIARRYFRVVGLEVYPMNSGDYAFLRRCGADFVTVFQETYHLDAYRKMHPDGRKAVYPYRFYAQERAILGGLRGVGFAALLGLADFRADAYATGMHAWLLQRKYPHAEIALSCPRLRPVPGGGEVRSAEMDEADLLQVISAYRLFLPYANIVISSRENARFRDNAATIAATKISAGVHVGIGGRTDRAKGDEQFKIDDGRSVEEIHRMLLRRGMQPVMSEYL